MHLSRRGKPTVRNILTSHYPITLGTFRANKGRQPYPTGVQGQSTHNLWTLVRRESLRETCSYACRHTLTPNMQIMCKVTPESSHTHSDITTLNVISKQGLKFSLVWWCVTTRTAGWSVSQCNSPFHWSAGLVLFRRNGKPYSVHLSAYKWKATTVSCGEIKHVKFKHIMQVITTKNRVFNKLNKPQQHKTEGFKYITQAMATQNRVLNTLQRPWQHMTDGFKHTTQAATQNRGF